MFNVSLRKYVGMIAKFNIIPINKAGSILILSPRFTINGPQNVPI